MYAFLSKLIRRADGERGFTMIELLVVITIIGILAVAVLSAINPIEQINKGRDTRGRSDAAELLSAIERYYATREEYPWNTTGGTLPATALIGGGSGTGTTAIGSANTFNWLTQLSTQSEVKPAFITRVRNDADLIVNKGPTAEAVTYICFAPSSNAFKLEAAKNCSTGTLPQPLWAGGPDMCTTAAGGAVVIPTTGVDYLCVP